MKSPQNLNPRRSSPKAAWLTIGWCALACFAGGIAAGDDHPTLTLTAPHDNEVFRPAETIGVQAVGLGRFGGITDTELLLDDVIAGESHIDFFRAPTPDEPVYHEFSLLGLKAGSHTLVVREIGNPDLASGAVTIRVEDIPPADPVPSLRILSPMAGATFELGRPITVDAVGIGRFGGITHVELFLDDAKAGESQITFIRAPSADEPVYHHFNLDPAPALGPHRLVVREFGNPKLASAEVPFDVVVTAPLAASPILRMTPLNDGTLMLVLSLIAPAARVQIEASSDLLQWEPLSPEWPARVAPVSKSMTVTPTGSTRFYRVLLTSETAR